MRNQRRETKRGKRHRLEIVLFLWRTHYDTGAWPLLVDVARHIHLTGQGTRKHIERLRKDGVICAEYGNYTPLRLNLKRLEHGA